MLPEFDEFGLLPPGVHRTTREEFEQRFVRFARSDRRFQVYNGLRRLLEDAAKSEFVKRVIVAGSFVTEKDEPNDFDCLLLLDGAAVDRELRPLDYNLVSRRAARARYGGDVVAVVERTAAELQLFDFFQTTRDGRRMGVVEVEQ